MPPYRERLDADVPNLYYGRPTVFEDFHSSKNDIPIFILGLPVFKTPHEIREILSKYGQPTSVKVWSSRAPDHARTMGVVTFRTFEECANTIRNMSRNSTQWYFEIAFAKEFKRSATPEQKRKMEQIEKDAKDSSSSGVLPLIERQRSTMALFNAEDSRSRSSRNASPRGSRNASPRSRRNDSPRGSRDDLRVTIRNRHGNRDDRLDNSPNKRRRAADYFDPGPPPLMHHNIPVYEEERWHEPLPPMHPNFAPPPHRDLDNLERWDEPQQEFIPAPVFEQGRGRGRPSWVNRSRRNSIEERNPEPWANPRVRAAIEEESAMMPLPPPEQNHGRRAEPWISRSEEMIPQIVETQNVRVVPGCPRSPEPIFRKPVASPVRPSPFTSSHSRPSSENRGKEQDLSSVEVIDNYLPNEDTRSGSGRLNDDRGHGDIPGLDLAPLEFCKRCIQNRAVTPCGRCPSSNGDAGKGNLTVINLLDEFKILRTRADMEDYDNDPNQPLDEVDHVRLYIWLNCVRLPDETFKAYILRIGDDQHVYIQPMDYRKTGKLGNELYNMYSWNKKRLPEYEAFQYDLVVCPHKGNYYRACVTRTMGPTDMVELYLVDAGEVISIVNHPNQLLPVPAHLNLEAYPAMAVKCMLANQWNMDVRGMLETLKQVVKKNKNIVNVSVVTRAERGRPPVISIKDNAGCDLFEFAAWSENGPLMRPALKRRLGEYPVFGETGRR